MSRPVLLSVVRVAAMSAGPVLVAAAGGWLAGVGVAGLSWILGVAGALALDLLAAGFWEVRRPVVGVLMLVSSRGTSSSAGIWAGRSPG